jgi:hypothetical protein
MIRRALRRLVGTLSKLSRLPDWVDWLLSLVEPLVVLSIAAASFYIGYYLVVSPENGPRQAQYRQLIKEINDNWKAGILLLILLFYRTVRTFLEQAEEAFSVKRPLRGESQEGPSPSRE